MFNRLSQDDKSLRLGGTAVEVAVFVTVSILAVAVLAVAIDRYSEAGWDSPLLQAWTLVPQLLATIGVLYLGRLRSSKAFWILGGLLSLIVLEEAFHVLNPLSSWLGDVANWAKQWTDVRIRGFSAALIYVIVAVFGLGVLATSYWYGSASERPVVRNIALLLLVGGLFGGPLNVVSFGLGSHNWQTVEELGEAIAFAAIAGYVSGLVTAESDRRSSRRRSVSRG